MIDTLPASPQTVQGTDSGALAPHRPDWAIVLSIPVDADARRISQALTTPEYLEAWMSMPNQQEDSTIVASHGENGYRVDHCLAGRVVASLSGCFLFCHQRKMRLQWRSARNSELSESIVDFRIRGNFGSSVLELRHTALCTVHEFLWHQKLWHTSLNKLAALMRSQSVRPT